MRTIGRFWPNPAPAGDYQCSCDICGVHWRRSQMRRDASGRLVCPDDQRGRDEVTLDRGNAAAAARRRVSRRMDGGNYDDDMGLDDPPQRLTAEDVEL